VRRARVSMVCALLAAALVAAACGSDGQAPPVAANAEADSADQILFGVHMLLTGSGVQRGELFADTMFMYDDNTRADLRQVRATFFTELGVKDGTLTAKRGTYYIRLGSMEGRGDVVVTTESGRRLETPHLRYDPGTNEITSDSAFVFTEPERRLQGFGFVTDPQMNAFRVLSNARASGKSLPLPRP
jgi:LPS export ABC transporter protein LptC